MTPSVTFTAKPHHQLSSLKLLESFPQVRLIREESEKFIYTLVHEIRNPLTNINLALEILKPLIKDESQKKYLDIIIRNSGRIKDMVTDLLTLRNTHGVNPEKNSVHYLLEEVLMMNEDRFIFKNVTVRKHYTAQDCKKEFNRFKLKIALTNIIINAIEAMPAKGGLLEITTKLLHGICFIIIQDNGAGISKENLNKLFKPYFTNKPGGLGLGLSVTLSILKSNHISINVRSEVGKGTKFILSYKKE